MSDPSESSFHTALGWVAEMCNGHRFSRWVSTGSPDAIDLHACSVYCSKRSTRLKSGEKLLKGTLTHVCIIASIVQEVRIEAQKPTNLLKSSLVRTRVALKSSEHISSVNNVKTFVRCEIGQYIREIRDRCFDFS